MMLSGFCLHLYSRLNRSKHLSDLYQANKNTEAQNWAKEEIEIWLQIAS